MLDLLQRLRFVQNLAMKLNICRVVDFDLSGLSEKEVEATDEGQFEDHDEGDGEDALCSPVAALGHFCG